MKRPFPFWKLWQGEPPVGVAPALVARGGGGGGRGGGRSVAGAVASVASVASGGGGGRDEELAVEAPKDTWNYALLVALYTLQGIPMGLSASIPFLIQQKVKRLATSSSSSTTQAYNAQAIFALCSWPFSLKLLWAPLVDAVFWRRMGRRKSWLVPVQAMAGLLMVAGSNYVEQELGLEHDNGGGSAGGVANAARNLMEQAAHNDRGVSPDPTPSFSAAAAAEASSSFAPSMATTAATAASEAAASGNFSVKGVTLFFFVLYFLMATQDIAVDGWALTLLQKKNRGRGPICNSIGQNLGYFLSFVGFLAFQDADTCERLWRPLLGLPSNPTQGLVSLQSFLQTMGILMLALTTLVALFKREDGGAKRNAADNHTKDNDDDEDAELDASRIGLAETYRRLWAVCQLPAVRWLFWVLLTYRFPTALSDNVRFLKAVDWGLDKQVTALLSPLLILPLGIAVPLVAARVWHGRHPLTQFLTAYHYRVTLVPLLDVAMLYAVRHFSRSSPTLLWVALVASTALQTICFSLQFNAQMVFFAQCVDPAIGGSYMTLLNTAANLGGTWPASVVLYLVGQLTTPPTCVGPNDNNPNCTPGRDGYVPLQVLLSVLGLVWIATMKGVVQSLAHVGPQAWKTNIGPAFEKTTTKEDNDDEDKEEGRAFLSKKSQWQEKKRD